jgi:catechol 2,3-dioxygenase
LERTGSEIDPPAGDSSGQVSLMPGPVRLRVADIDRSREFYERTIGLPTLDDADGVVQLGAGGVTAVELVPSPGAPPRPPRTTGLFHLAILVPDRLALAQALARAAASGWRLAGASDHLVSEALYLNDPEGNGIEIYRDRPRSEWRYAGGDVEMSTLPLDVEDLLGELPGPVADELEMAAGARLGHVHLNVADLDEAEDFYKGVLGFDVTVRGYPGALFLSTGGYHHHVAVNTWGGPGTEPPPNGSRGLVWFELTVDGPAPLEDVRSRLAGAGIEAEELATGIFTRDPSGNGLLVARKSGA